MPWITTSDIPPQIQERIVCSISAALKYQVPANIILGVAEKEAGKPGQWIRNSDGSYDVGQMQFNTNYLADLAHYGITANDVAATGCNAFHLATWRLRTHFMIQAIFGRDQLITIPGHGATMRSIGKI